MGRDDQTDASRTGRSGDPGSQQIDTMPYSILEEAKRDKAMGNPTTGTRGAGDMSGFRPTGA